MFGLFVLINNNTNTKISIGWSMNNKSSTKFIIICQSLYLANLLLLPVFCFFTLLYYLYRYKKQSNTTSMSNINRVEKIHLYRSIQLSVLAGLMLGVLPLIFVLMSDNVETSIMVMLFYFISMHASFVLLGMLNLSKAMAGKLPIF